MKLYKIASAPAGERWHSSKTGIKDFEEVELPKEGRTGMAAFLNANEHDVAAQPSGTALAYASSVAGPLDPLEAAELRAVAAAKAASVAQERAWTATDIEDFILNRASVNEVSNIFGCLGSRFKEQANGA